VADRQGARRVGFTGVRQSAMVHRGTVTMPRLRRQEASTRINVARSGSTSA
jgi:hypothetical protein